MIDKLIEALIGGYFDSPRDREAARGLLNDFERHHRSQQEAAQEPVARLVIDGDETSLGFTRAGARLPEGSYDLSVSCPAPSESAAKDDPIRALIAHHESLLDQSEYTYFELAYTRQTGWMAFITDKPLAYTVVNPDRKVLAQGQGDSADEACRAAMAASGGESDAGREGK